MRDIETKDDIVTLIDSFYEFVNKDELLAPIFEASGIDWPHHLPRMYNFWATLLIGDMSYSGSPFSVHAGLPVDKSHFDRWVSHFVKAADEHFAGPVTEQAKNFARTNAVIFESKMRFS